MLDQMISKTFQICEKIDTKDVYVDICAVITSHLKEYSKALKRHEESPTTPVESLYKKTHPISNDKKYESADHCVNLLRVVLKELVPWELWDTPQSEILVRVLSKKLDIFIDSTLSDPIWLNDKLLSIIKEKKDEGKLDFPMQEEFKETENNSSEEIYTEINPLFSNIEPTSLNINTVETVKGVEEGKEEFQERMESIVEEKAVQSTDPMDIKSSPILRQRRGRQGKNEVKIYDRVIEGSMKTWETDMDLQCISLGQDLLASLDGEITLSRLWGQDVDPDGSPNPPRAKSPQPFWFGEEDAIELECGDSSPQKPSEPSPVKKESSPKPAELLKDIQSTVHHAKSKIGDLQVPYTHIDVPRKHSSDEAAGMMEGLLDFGIAGIKKGLRFTGLSDDSQEKSPSHQAKDKASEKISPPQDMGRKPIQEHRDITIASAHNENDAVPQLVKQHRVTSQDSMGRRAGSWPPQEGGAESPEPEYEEAADLSTSIAKLRCLLQQRAETAQYRSDEIWWEGAEETRGRTQQHHSSRPVDTATLAEEWCSSCGAGWSGACAVAGAAGLCRSHVAFRLATLLFADLAESLLASWLDELSAWLRQQVFVVFQQLSGDELDLTSKGDQLRPLDIDETCAAIMAVIPEMYVFSEEGISAAVRLSVSSLRHKDLNKDLMFRTLDLMVARYKHAAGITSTSFDAN
ncbi:hypothetical protein RR46_09511 [Papilio xuthus]|uniref:PXA domain-containing protein n=1 Tax=Papilio xuthus TaxID=66420 RepID=A0A194Q4G0_PAPXU|nr:hypothetical protein RR46_09511 [Papilio xuthus]